MSYQMNFDRLLNYDAGVPGILLEVTLKLAKVSVSIPAKLDTGSANSIFARHYAVELGLQLERGYRQWFSTATGNFLAYGHNLSINIANIEFGATVFFAAEEAFNRNVIGRYGGLDNLNVGLVDYEGKLYLSKYGDE